MNELAAKISASEVEVLEVLWQADAPMPIAAIRAALEGGHQWDASTVKTLLRRLCGRCGRGGGRRLLGHGAWQKDRLGITRALPLAQPHAF